MSRRVAWRSIQGPVEIAPGLIAHGISFQAFDESTGEPIDVLAGHDKLEITNYMVKIRLEYLSRSGPSLPAGGSVDAIDETHVVVDGVPILRSVFVEMYEVD